VSYYPVFLDLRGQHCVVIGGGQAALAKARALREAGAEVLAIAAEDYRPGLLAGVRLAILASADPELIAAVRAEADAEGVLLNVVDHPGQCDFIAPAVVRRGDLQVAISTSGQSPFLASALRGWLERLLGEEWCEFVRLAGRIRRELKRRKLPMAAQTRIYQRLLDSNVLDLLREGAVAAAHREAERIVASELQPVRGR
jgi:siroheme synthase-like protein